MLRAGARKVSFLGVRILILMLNYIPAELCARKDVNVDFDELCITWLSYIWLCVYLISEGLFMREHTSVLWVFSTICALSALSHVLQGKHSGL